MSPNLDRMAQRAALPISIRYIADSFVFIWKTPDGTTWTYQFRTARGVRKFYARLGDRLLSAAKSPNAAAVTGSPPVGRMPSPPHPATPISAAPPCGNSAAGAL